MHMKITVVLFYLVTMVHLKPIDDDMLLFWRRSGITGAVSCKPFTMFSINCNKCVCSADGIPFCTRMACVKKNPYNETTKSLAAKDQYETISKIRKD